MDLNSPLDSLGIDSLMRIELAGKLKDTFAERKLDQNQLAELETLQALVDEVSSIFGALDDNTVSKQRIGVSESNVNPKKPVSTRNDAYSTPRQESTPNPVSLKVSNMESTPLHLFHDGSGKVSFYKRLEDLGRSIYGFADPHFSTPEMRHESLVYMAADYISKLDDFHSRPLILGGKSMLAL